MKLDELKRQLRPHVEKLVDAIVDRVVAEYSGAADRALVLAREALQLELEETDVKAEAERRAPAKDAAIRKARSPRRAKARRPVREPARSPAPRGGRGAARRVDRGRAREDEKPAPVAAAEPRAGRTPKTCGSCGKQGHNARTCPDRREVVEAAPAAELPIAAVAKPVIPVVDLKPPPPLKPTSFIKPTALGGAVRKSGDRFAQIEQRAAERRRAAELD